MKTENKILMIIIIVALIMSIYLVYISLNPYKEKYLLTINPLSEITVLNNKVIINDNQKLYKQTIDCTNLEKNEQILFYKLKDSKKEYKISASIRVLENDKILKESYKNATSIESKIIIQDKDNKYEQIYIIESICQQGDIS